MAPFVSQALAVSAGGDAEILNFALTLEYLESDFYNVKGKAVGLSGQAKSYATLFGEEEQAHVQALTTVIKQLGAKPVEKPTFVFPVEQSELVPGAGVGPREHGRRRLQRSGAIAAKQAVLAAAGSIVQIEARHAAAIDLLIGQPPTPNGGFDVPLTKAEVLAKAGPLIKA